MTSRQAIILFAQSEKIKSALIWAAQTVELYIGSDPGEKPGAEKVIDALARMVATEALFARKITGDDGWLEVEKSIDMAVVMIKSGVTAEASYHFSQAISRVTGISQRAMTLLQEKGLL